ncbi:MAG: hypothetical protein HFI28_06520, partial [Lachnospiraceae bacterium]|nr:hypothetical protein [Lachnospiraceae bacterium]
MCLKISAIRYSYRIRLPRLRSFETIPCQQSLSAIANCLRNPVWTPDGKSFYYLSEQNGTFNVYRRN